MTDLLTDIKELMKQERELFGESLLLEYPQKEREEPVAKKKTVAREEPLLFELPGVPVPPLTTEPWGTAASLAEFESQIRDCVKCPLGQTRTNFVFGVGNPQATLMLIGEAPGAEEDAQGEPFVGRAGQLLNKILEAIHFKREEVYICNILKCRPPGNRKPAGEEIDLCLPYLKKQIALIRPKLILCLGLTAIENLLQTTESLTALRGRVLTHDGIPVMVTYHPAALLRNPNWKRPAWEDLQAARKLHDELVAKGSA
jgi:uracil-DNA glycosylase family 4